MVERGGSIGTAAQTGTEVEEMGNAEVEAIADELIGRNSFMSDGTRILTERQLMRKIKDEFRCLPEVPLDGLPPDAIEYVIERHIALLLKNIKLTGFQREAYVLHLQGWAASDIAAHVGISRQRVNDAILFARRETLRVRDKYAGLHEVYWREVHRYIYRKPRSKRT